VALPDPELLRERSPRVTRHHSPLGVCSSLA
jgi:hypothetical protein